MNSPNLESDISIKSLYTLQITAKLFDLNISIRQWNNNLILVLEKYFHLEREGNLLTLVCW